MSACPVFILSFFFINCIIKYCCLLCWRPAVMASALPVASRTLFTCLFIFMFGFCAKKINSSSSSSSSELINWINSFFLFYTRCTITESDLIDSSALFTLRASCGAVYCNQSCLWACVWVGGWDSLPR